MTDPEKQDPKKQDETVEQPTAAAQESGGTDLTDEELSDAAGGGTDGWVVLDALESIDP